MDSVAEQRIHWPESETSTAIERLIAMQKYIKSLGYFEHCWQEDDTWVCVVGDETSEPVLLSYLKNPSCKADEALSRRLRHSKKAGTPEQATLKAFLSWHSHKVAVIDCLDE